MIFHYSLHKSKRKHETMNLPLAQNTLIRKLVIPKVREAMLDWQNMLSRKKSNLEFSLHGDLSYSASILPLSEASKKCTVGVLIELDGVPAPLWFSSWPMPEKIKALSGGKDITQLPADLRSELLEIALKPLINLLVLKTNANVRIINFLSLKPTRIHGNSVAFRIVEQQSNDATEALLVMHEKLIPVFKGLLAYWPMREVKFWQHLNMPAAIEIASSELLASQLSTLELNDIVLVDDSSTVHATSLKLRLRSGDYFSAKLFPENIVFDTGLIEMNENDYNNDAGSIEDIPVKLSFDLGEIELPFNQLKTITEGYTVQLDKPLPMAVTIRSHNKVIGFGDLVDIDGNIGVRVSRLFESK